MNNRISMEVRWKNTKTEREEIERKRVHCHKQMVM